MARPLSGKHIVLGVTGSIAAYKAAELIRRLQREEAELQVVMTEAASRFITADTLRTLSGRPVLTDLFAEPVPWRVEHVSLADWAELVIIAPATANTIARLACGLADDLLSCLALSTRAPLLIAPAMDEGMLLHPATQANLGRLAQLGYSIMEAETGPLASGKQGAGRMASIDRIIAEAQRVLSPQDFAGLRVVITAGPTREAIDPVRFISNPSSGKMGYRLAACARRRGGRVSLISGPTALTPPFGVEIVSVESAAEMHEAVLKKTPGAEVFIGAAAVGDFAPEEKTPQKIKRNASFSLRLRATPDIIAAVAEMGEKRPKVVVGFAAEKENLIENAREKLARKGLDLVVANDICQPGGVFGTDFNEATLLFADGRLRPLGRLAKSDLAEEVLDAVKALLKRETEKG